MDCVIFHKYAYFVLCCVVININFFIPVKSTNCTNFVTVEIPL